MRAERYRRGFESSDWPPQDILATGGRVAIHWDTPVGEIVARPSPLASLPLRVRILGALLLATGAVIAIYAFFFLALGVYMATDPFLYARGGTYLVRGVIYSVSAALLGIAGGGVLRTRAWGRGLALVASVATFVFEDLRLSMPPPYGPSANSYGWLAVGANWLPAVLSGVVLVYSLAAIADADLRRLEVDRQIGR